VCSHSNEVRFHVVTANTRRRVFEKAKDGPIERFPERISVAKTVRFSKRIFRYARVNTDFITWARAFFNRKSFIKSLRVPTTDI